MTVAATTATLPGPRPGLCGELMLVKRLIEGQPVGTFGTEFNDGFLTPDHRSAGSRQVTQYEAGRRLIVTTGDLAGQMLSCNPTSVAACAVAEDMSR